MLLYHALSNRLNRSELRLRAANQKPTTVNMAISRLIKDRSIRVAANAELALTPIGQKRVREQLLPKHRPKP